MNASKDFVRLGIIGLGNMGNAHAKTILEGQVPDVKLTAVADQNPALLAKFGDLERFGTGSELIQKGSVDAVLIATPHYTHTTLGKEALQQGLHVLVEKPISVHKADCEELIKAHTNPKQVFAAMFNQRTDPSFLKLRQLIQSNELGKIERINWIITSWFRTEHYYQSGDWRATWGGEGGGVLLNQCPHNLDLWQWLFGMPDRLIANCQFGRFHDIEVEDAVTAVMEYSNGTTGVFVTTTGEAPGTNRLEVAADRGKVVIEDGVFRFIRTEVPVSEYLQSSRTSFGKPESWNIEIPIQGGTGPQHVGILNNFAKAILHNEELLAPAAEGIHSVELANAMLYSAFLNQRVDLPMDGSDYAAILKKKTESSTHRKRKPENIKAGVSDDFSESF